MVKPGSWCPKHCRRAIEKMVNDKNRYPQIEEYVEGEGYGCSVLYSKGEFIAHFTQKTKR